MKCSIIIIFSLCLTACAGRPLGRIRVIHFTDDFSEKKSVGNLKVKRCQYSAGKYTVGQSLSAERAYQELIDKKGGLSYVENLSFSKDDSGITGIASKECLVVKGRGYR